MKVMKGNGSEIPFVTRELPHTLTHALLFNEQHHDQKQINTEPIMILTHPRCLKITETVSFNIASEASYVYISIKMPKMVHFDEFLKT